MAGVEEKETSGWRGLWGRYKEVSREVHRGFVAEWTVTIILLLFATTSLVQAFVIPSASMVGTLLIGDHVLVDKLTYAPYGALAGKVLPYRQVRQADYPWTVRRVGGWQVRSLSRLALRMATDNRPAHQNRQTGPADRCRTAQKLGCQSYRRPSDQADKKAVREEWIANRSYQKNARGIQSLQ